MIEMDKIQGALIKHNNKGEFAFSNDIEITEREWDEALDSYFKAGYKSRDEEIQKVIEFEKIDKIRIEEGLDEIKKLKEALKEIT